MQRKLKELEAHVFDLTRPPEKQHGWHTDFQERNSKMDAFTPLLSSYRLTPHKVIRELLPYTNSRIEYELMMDHPKAYPVLAPLDVSTVEHLPEMMRETLLNGTDQFR